MNACVVISYRWFTRLYSSFLFPGSFLFRSVLCLRLLETSSPSSFRSRIILYMYLSLYIFVELLLTNYTNALLFFVFLRLNNILLVCDILLLHNPYAVFRVMCRTSRLSASAPHYSLAGLVVRVPRPRSRLYPFGRTPERSGKCCWGDSGLRMWGKTWLTSRTIATTYFMNELLG